MDANGAFGVAVNTSFPFGTSVNFAGREARAGGNTSGSITNNTTVPIDVVADFFIPEPTLIMGGGNFPVPGINAARLAQGFTSINLLTTLIHPDGTSEGPDTVFTYGLTVRRDPFTGVMLVLPDSDQSRQIESFESVSGLGFRLPALTIDDFPLGQLGPGDRVDFLYIFDAVAGTSLGEQGVFAAIGDPFNIEANGGRFNVRVIDATAPPPTTAIPEPSTCATLVVGLGVLMIGIRLRRRADLTQSDECAQ